MRCFGCDKIVWFWQRKGPNSAWHHTCYTTWEKGYFAAIAFIDDELAMHSMPSVDALYKERIQRCAERGEKVWQPTKTKH